MPASVYSKVIADQICEKLNEGTPLREICRMEGFPNWRTVYDWMVKDEELSAHIARARELGQDAIAEDTLQIVDSEPERGADGKIDPAWVNLQRIRVEHRLKLLAKWNPKRYGDRIQTEHSGQVDLNTLTEHSLDSELMSLLRKAAKSD